MLADAPPPKDAARFLKLAQAEERGRLKAILGAAPGVGKTYEMLSDGAAKRRGGCDVVIGVVETHGRAETEALVEGFEVIPRREVPYEGRTLHEMDLDAILARRPTLVLVDELAHTNAPGSRHPKRWQDVEELLAAGIDVYTTVNIQHIESLNDVVAGFTHIRVRETVPDKVLEDAELEIVDIPPAELIERMEAGKVYLPETADRALANFFTPTKLAALRELALRFAARNVDRRLADQLVLSGEQAGFRSGERLMVAVSPGKGGARVIRQAKRLADMLQAPWTATVVESGSARAIRGAQREQLADNLALASSLGASLMTVAANGVAEALVGQARELRASQIVIGKSRRSRWFEWRHGSVVADVIRRAEGVAVHVVPLDEPDEKPASTISPDPQRDNILAFLVVAATVALLHLAMPLLANDAVALLLLLPVILCATLLKRSAALLAAVLAGLSYNFFFTEPLHTFAIDRPQDLIVFLTLTLVAFVIGGLAGQIRRQAETSMSVARLNASLARFAGLMGSLSTAEETAEVACREIGGLLDVEAVIVTQEEDRLLVRGNARYQKLDLVDEAAARWAMENGEATGRDTGTLNASDWQFHPLRTALGTMGVLGVARPSQARIIRPDDATLLASLVDQTALAHERLVLEAKAREIDAFRERDRLRGALLGSIAHDLRTPLTAVIAATEAVPVEGAFAKELRIAREEFRRLQRFLEDLLQASRIEHNAIAPQWELIDLTDIINAVVRDLRQDAPGSRINLVLDEDCSLVRTDPVLLRHLLLNLVDNALKYSEPSSLVTIELTSNGRGAECSVLDHGPGLPAEPEVLFERFHRIEGSDRSGGLGLGLWIAKSFADVLDCTLTAGSRQGGGAQFTLSVPLLAESRAEPVHG